MKSGTANLLDMLTERVLTLTNEGLWDDACHTAEAAVDKARHAVLESEGGSGLALASALEIKGDLKRQMGEMEDARLAYSEAIELASQHSGEDEMLARLSSSVGVLYDMVENDEEAIRFYERGLEMYGRCGLGESEEVADVCNNLGFIYRSIGNFKAAEDLLLKGLEICHKTWGSHHEKTATLCNNLGALYLKSGYDEQAREMNTMALDGRLKSLGDDHPDTAQSHANLALSLAQTGEGKDARSHFQQAVMIYEKHLVTEMHEYAAVVENYVEFLKASDDTKEAGAVLKKAQKKLSKISQNECSTH